MRKASITIGARHEILAKAGAPLRRVRGSLRNRFQIQAPRTFTTHQNRERVIKTKLGADFKIKLFRVFTFDLIVDSFRIGNWLMMKNRGERCTGVLGIEIDLSRCQRGVSEISRRSKTRSTWMFFASNIWATISASRFDSVKSFE